MTGRQKQRLLLIAIFGGGFLLVLGLILYALEQNINLYYTPSDVSAYSLEPDEKKIFKLGGMVKQGSFSQDQNLKASFVVTDFFHELQVEYEGILPDLFKEGQGVVATGFLKANKIYQATNILAKHDENYMPPELASLMDRNKDL